MISFTRRAFAIATLTMAAISPAASQTPAPQPVSASPPRSVVLTVSGKVRTPGQDLTIADLEALPRSTIRTRTPWHDGEQTFEGVPLVDLLSLVGASGRTLRVKALNNYQTEIPVSDAAQHRAILAYKRNGAYMPVRDKGPLFVIYPYDADPVLRSEIFFSRSAWQVRSIDIE